VLKTVIFALKVDLTSNFMFDRQTVLKSCKNQGLDKFSCSIRYKTCFSDLWQLFWQRSRGKLSSKNHVTSHNQQHNNLDV